MALQVPETRDSGTRSSTTNYTKYDIVNTTAAFIFNENMMTRPASTNTSRSRFSFKQSFQKVRCATTCVFTEFLVLLKGIVDMSLVWLSCYKKLKHEIEDAAKEEQLLLKQQQEVASKAKQSHTAGQKIKKKSRQKKS